MPCPPSSWRGGQEHMLEDGTFDDAGTGPQPEPEPRQDSPALRALAGHVAGLTTSPTGSTRTRPPRVSRPALSGPPV